MERGGGRKWGGGGGRERGEGEGRGEPHLSVCLSVWSVAGGGETWGGGAEGETPPPYRLRAR